MRYKQASPFSKIARLLHASRSRCPHYRKRGSQHHVIGCIAVRIRLHCWRCWVRHTRADRTATHQGKHLFISREKLSPDQSGISMASTPRSFRNSDRNPLGSSESGRIQKCRVKYRPMDLLIPDLSRANRCRSRPSVSSRSLSRVLKASHRRRLMSVMRFVVRANELLTAFLELESAVRGFCQSHC
jgi:hypothetical protein